VAQKISELGKNNDLAEQEIKKIGKELAEWKQSFNNRELAEIKGKWESLNKRPDITITTQQF